MLFNTTYCVGQNLIKVTKLILFFGVFSSHIIALGQFNTVQYSKKKGTVSMIAVDTIQKIDSVRILIKEKKVEYNMGTLPLDDIIVTDEYGKRIHPVTGKKSFHSGIDLRAKGKYVYAVQQGIITDVGYDRFLGEYVKLKCGTFEFIYGHLDHIYKTLGETVGVGEVLGQTGDTGRVTAEHLHFGIKNNGKFIDPYPILKLIHEHSNLIIDTSGNNLDVE